MQAMSIETFDQRFKRLTSDMLMIDLCRLLGIEIRHLMKIRSGVRVELSMDGLRKLCLEQGLDFSSFVRGYADPWSSELEQTEVITSDAPTEAPLQIAAAAAPAKGGRSLFRSDGSRLPVPPPPPKRSAPVETVRSSAPPAPPAPPEPPAPPIEKPRQAQPPAAQKKLQVSFRPVKAPQPPTVPEKYEPQTDDEIFEDDFDPRPSIASRLREVVTSAFRRNDVQSEQVELYSGVTPARIVTSRGSSVISNNPSEANTPLEKTQAKEIQSLISEVSSLRREIDHLSTSVRELLER